MLWKSKQDSVYRHERKNQWPLRVQPAEKCVFHLSEKHGGLFLQEKGFCLSKQAPYLSSLHHFLPLTSKVNGRSTKLKLSLCEPLTFGACLLLLTLQRHHKIKEMSWYAEIILMWKAWHVYVLYSLTHTQTKTKKACLFELEASQWEREKRGIFPWRVCQHTKQRKEQQWVKQWALVFQHSTCSIIYTPLTGAILKSVIDGKLFVSKRLAHSESTSAGVRVINHLWPYCVEVAN